MRGLSFARRKLHRRLPDVKQMVLLWKSLLTSYPLGEVEVFEREANQGDGFAFGVGGEMIAAAVVVGKSESRGVGGISKRGGKPAFGFPRRVFSTTFFASTIKMRRLCRPVTSI